MASHGVTSTESLLPSASRFEVRRHGFSFSKTLFFDRDSPESQAFDPGETSVCFTLMGTVISVG